MIADFFRRDAIDSGPFVWLMCVVALVYGVALFNHSLVPSMEPRFAEVVREMIATGEWLIPIKNGRPYVEYPPLYYWLAIALKQIGLPMTAAVRLPSYASFLTWLVLLQRWQGLVAPHWPRWAFALAGAAAPLAMFQFAIAQTDSLLTLGVSLALYGYAQHSCPSGRKGISWLMWVGIALACAAKGPVGAACTLPVVVADTFFATMLQSGAAGRPRFRQLLHGWLSLGWLRGLGLVAVVNVPWYVVAGLYRGWDFVNAVLVYQNLDRYLTGYSHPRPWWYYAETISYDFFPMSLLLPFGIYAAFRRRSEPFVRLVLIWALWTLLFFTLSGSKQGKYLLPAAPALIGLGFVGLDAFGERLRQTAWAAIRTWSIVLISLWSILIVVALPGYSDRIGGAEGLVGIRMRLELDPGRVVHFRWPRSLTLYELGAPMDFARSSRELYQRIHDGELLPGDYVLVSRDDLGSNGTSPEASLLPYPNLDVFEEVETSRSDSELVLLRVVPGAADAPLPDTPDPPTVLWRDRLFDTD